MIWVQTIGKIYSNKLLNIREIVIFKEDLILPKLKHTGLYFVVTTLNNPRYKLITIFLDFHILITNSQ